MKAIEVGQFIREQRTKSRLTLRKLAEKAGVSDPYLSQIERGLRRPSADILQAIAKGLRISAESLYVKAGMLEESRDLDTAASIMGDPGLTIRQRQVLVRNLRKFSVRDLGSQIKIIKTEAGKAKSKLVKRIDGGAE